MDSSHWPSPSIARRRLSRRTRAGTALLASAAVLTLLLTLPDAAAAALAAEPQMAVYRGTPPKAPDEVDAYARWVNRPDLWAEGFTGSEHWDSISHPTWLLGPWETWLKRREGRKLLLSVPMLVGPGNLSGPAAGPEAKIPVSHAEGARGRYNPHFAGLATDLVARGIADRVIIRLGWEFNGGWYQWRVAKQQTREYREFFRQIVTTMRSVPGAEKLLFCWNPNMMWMPYSKQDVYPGDDVVDYIGIDIYDQSWLTDTYPYPTHASADEIEVRQKRAWDMDYAPQLRQWSAYAKERTKPFCFPEWGVFDRPDHHGGLDNPIFIERMHAFIMDPGNGVAFHCYFEVPALDGGHQLSPGKDGTYTTEFPRSAARFHELFRVPDPVASASVGASR